MKNPKDRSNVLRRSRPTSGRLPSLIAIATFVLIIGSLYWAQAILIPIALSLMLTFLLSPVASASERIGLGRLPSVILIVVLTFSLLGGIGWLVTLQFGSLANELPQYTSNITQKIADVRGAGKGGALEKVQKTVEEVKSKIEKAHEPTKTGIQGRPVVVQAEESFAFWPLPLAVGPMMERFASAGLVIVLVIFMLIYREDLRNRLIRLIGYGRLTVTTRALEEAGQRISRYLLMQTIINASFGLAIGSVFFLIGLPYAVLWGFLAAVLRFIPYVGPFAAAVMPSALSLAVFQGWMWPIAVVGLFLVLELINNMVLEPLLYGESAGVSKVGLLVALAFWTWLWGPVGLVLATPLTVCVVVLGKYVPQLDFIGVLMGDEPVLESNISYYQRLLAMDQDEAAEIVEGHLKSNPAEQIYDDVLVPALNYAGRDRELGRLTENDQQFMFQATREILESLVTRDPQIIESSSNASEAAMVNDNPSATSPKVRIIGCPARDEADELALLMLQQLIDPIRYEMELVAEETLTSEVVALIAEKSPALICIASLPPGGLTQTRYFCKRLRARFPNLKILVARWGTASGDNNKILLSAGADKVAATMIEARDQMIQLIQISPDSGHSGATLAPLSPPDETLIPEVRLLTQ
jgi:predicted PurR-regulated permease PerM